MHVQCEINGPGIRPASAVPTPLPTHTYTRTHTRTQTLLPTNAPPPLPTHPHADTRPPSHTDTHAHIHTPADKRPPPPSPPCTRVPFLSPSRWTTGHAPVASAVLDAWLSASLKVTAGVRTQAGANPWPNKAHTHRMTHPHPQHTQQITTPCTKPATQPREPRHGCETSWPGPPGIPNPTTTTTTGTQAILTYSGLPIYAPASCTRVPFLLPLGLKAMGSAAMRKVLPAAIMLMPRPNGPTGSPRG
jgi:hypothetical protein